MSEQLKDGIKKLRNRLPVRYVASIQKQLKTKKVTATEEQIKNVFRNRPVKEEVFVKIIEAAKIVAINERKKKHSLIKYLSGN